MTRVTIETYGDYTSDAYGVHTLKVTVQKGNGGVVFYYSYETIVAIEWGGFNSAVSENVWGPTTGRHINWLDNGNKNARLPREEFEEKVKEVCEFYEIEPPAVRQ